MCEKNLSCSRYIENFNPPNLIEKLEHKVCESVVDAFLAQIEYGKDYVIRTELVKEDWADGFGTKYTYSLKFDELDVSGRTCNLIEDGDSLHCSNCGGAAAKQSWAYWNHCPNCGARVLRNTPKHSENESCSQVPERVERENEGERESYGDEQDRWHQMDIYDYV